MGVNIEALKGHMLELFKEVAFLREENERLKNELEQQPKQKSIKDKIREQEEKEDISFYIKNQRKARGLSQHDIARLVGTNSTTISNYENGKGDIDNMRDITEKIRGLRGGRL